MVKTDTDTCQRTSWIGLDVSKRTFDAGVLLGGRVEPAAALATLPARAFARTPEGVLDFLQWLDTLIEESEPVPAPRCVMEATGRYSTELAVWLLAQRPCLAPAIASPRQTAAFIKSLGLRNSTDQLAARALALYGRERRPQAYVPLSPEEQELRDLCRYRDTLVRQSTAVKNQAGETTASAFVRHNQRKRLRLLAGDIERTETQLRDLVNQQAWLKHDVELLTTIYGVGFLTAVVIRAELGDLRRFDQARQLSAHAGLNPCIRQSGTSVHRRTRMGKQGNARVRQALYLSAIVTIQGRNDLQRTYRRLIDHGKSPMAALGAVMRKQLVLMRAILISGKPYDPNWKLGGKSASTHP